jgi:hypothetical protein
MTINDLTKGATIFINRIQISAYRKINLSSHPLFSTITFGTFAGLQAETSRLLLHR